MRDIKRIEPFLKKFRELWKLYPDMRFSQMIYLIAEEMKVNDIFYSEEDKWIKAIDNLIERRKSNG